jgi:SAM-dependent methyltransferase
MQCSSHMRRAGIEIGLWAILLLDLLWWGTRVAAGLVIFVFLCSYLLYRLQAVLDYRHSAPIRDRMTLRKVKRIEESFSRLDAFSTPEKRALVREGLDRYFYYVRYEQVQTLLDLFINDSYRVLDMGCGFAKNTMYVADQLKRIAIGLDLDEVKLRWAAREAGRREIRDLTALVCSDASCPPFRPQCFDCIVMTEALEHLVNPVQGFAACHELLAQDGFLMITVPSSHNVAYSNNPFIFMEKVISLIDDRVLPRYHNLHAQWEYNRRKPEPEYAIHYKFSRQRLEQMLSETGFRMIHRGSFELEILPYLVVEFLSQGNVEQIRKHVAPLERLITRLPVICGLGQHLVYVAQKRD